VRERERENRKGGKSEINIVILHEDVVYYTFVLLISK